MRELGSNAGGERDAEALAVPSAGDIRAWLLAWVEARSGTVGIDPREPFETYGLDSLDMSIFSGDLAEWLGRPLSPTLMYEHRSVEGLVAHLTAGPGDTKPAESGMRLAAAYAGGENFDLQGFVSNGAALRLEERVARFGELLDALGSAQRLTYRRVVGSAADREVDVLDPSTGKPHRMLMFGSNNYLGLANHPHVRAAVTAAVERYGVGVGGPPLFNGYTRLHAELEARLSAFKHAEATVLFASGYGANVGLLTGLVDPRRDAVVFDEYSHASFVDGLKMAGARPSTFPHNDADALARVLGARAAGQGDTFVGVEGVYSMDGDVAPLDRIVPICKRHGALLVVDDAHGTGVLGEGGAGTASHFGVAANVDVTMGTFSKAFGVVGGFVSASKPLVDYLRFFARSYVFSASLPPVVVAAVLAGLDVIEREPDRLTRLHENVRYAASLLGRIGLHVEPRAAILTLRTRPTMDVRRMSALFHEAGVFVNSVEYPAVPRDQQRIRISVMATHTQRDIERLVTCVEEIWFGCEAVAS